MLKLSIIKIQCISVWDYMHLLKISMYIYLQSHKHNEHINQIKLYDLLLCCVFNIFLNILMETLFITSLSIKLIRQEQKNHSSSIYCIIKTNDQSFCTKTYDIAGKEWFQLISNKNKLQLELQKNYVLFKLQVWDYDNHQKLSETHVTSNDLSISQNQKEFIINDVKIHLKMIYQRRQKLQQKKESQSGTLRISFNKSDNNLKSVSKPNSPYVRRVNVNAAEQFQMFPKYEVPSYPKWRVVPVRNDINPQKLRL